MIESMGVCLSLFHSTDHKSTRYKGCEVTFFFFWRARIPSHFYGVPLAQGPMG